MSFCLRGKYNFVDIELKNGHIFHSYDCLVKVNGTYLAIFTRQHKHLLSFAFKEISNILAKKHNELYWFNLDQEGGLR